MQAHVAFALLPSRSEVQSVDCPYCGAPKLMNCMGARNKPRLANHMERVFKFMGTNGGRFTVSSV
jgi:hypothetical protein